jgi:calcineurin-like phosphoesterase family protein
MKSKAKRWFISDLHLNHDKMLELDDSGQPYRPFSSIDEMNNTILENINECVKDDGRLFVLGDVLFKPATSYHLLERLPKRSILILGNHDTLTSNNYYLNYFKKVVLWINFEEYDFVCSHVPLMPEMFRNVAFNVHGHTHKHKLNDARYINVCVENTDYKPVSLEQILDEINSRRR